MIEALIKEFLSIVKHLKTDKKTTIKGSYMIVDKIRLIGLMDKHGYETSGNKLIAWRGMQWIDTDPGRLTKRVQQDGRTITAVKIRLQVYDTLKNMEETALK